MVKWLAKHHTAYGSEFREFQAPWEEGLHPPSRVESSQCQSWVTEQKGLGTPPRAVLCSPWTVHSYWLAEKPEFLHLPKGGVEVIIRGPISYACCQVQWLCDLGRSKFQLSPQWDGNTILCLEIRGEKHEHRERLMKGTPSPAWVQRWIFLEAQHRAEPRCVWWWPFTTL